MAKAAVNSQFTRVVLVAEGDRLFARDVYIGIPRRQFNSVQRSAEQRDDEHAAIDAQPRKNVCAGKKNLCHRNLLACYLPCRSSFVSSTKERISTMEIIGRKRMKR